MALATLLLLAPLIGLMPQAALAAVVVAASLELIKPAEFRAIRRVRAHRVPLGAGGVRRRDLPRHAAGHPGGGDRLAAGDRAAGLQPAGARHRPQARHRRVPAAFGRASRRRNLARPLDPASGRAPVLRQRAARGRDPPAAGRPRETRGHRARLPRGARYRVHRAQDARRGRSAAARRRHRAVARGLQPGGAGGGAQREALPGANVLQRSGGRENL